MAHSIMYTYLKRNFDSNKRVRCVCIGISTGGPETLSQILPLFPKDFHLPIVIVQHMKAFFTAQLAERLNELCNLEVKEISNNEVLKRGTIYIAPGDYHLLLKKYNYRELIGVLTQSQPINSCRPSVDVLYDSAYRNLNGEILAVIMTGMGYDGYKGIKALKSLDTPIIAQNEASCVVYGMPKKVIEEKLADFAIHSKDIYEAIMTVTKYNSKISF